MQFIVAGVVIVDNQKQVSETFDEQSDSGFQEVTRKKLGREKHRGQDDRPSSPTMGDKKDGKKKGPKLSGGPTGSVNYERQRQNKLPPRFAKKRENNRSKQENESSFFKEQSMVPPPPKNAWEKPLTAALRTNSPQHSSTTGNVAPPVAETATVSSNANVSTTPVGGTGIARETGLENHDSGVEVSDPPNSTGSSQRSSPSDNPLVFSSRHQDSKGGIPQGGVAGNSNALSSRMDKSVLDGSSVPSQTIIFENTNYKAAGTTVSVGAEYKAKMSTANSNNGGNGTTNEPPKPQRSIRERKLQENPIDSNNQMSRNGSSSSGSKKPEPIELPLSFVGKATDENSAEIKLDFTFDQELATLSGSSADKSRQSVVGAGSSMPRSSSLTLSSPSSPSTQDLNLKIASVKKVWDTMTPLAEHPHPSAPAPPPDDSTVSSSSFSAATNFSDKMLGDPSLVEASFGNATKDTTTEDGTGEVGYHHQGAGSLQGAPGMVAAMAYTSSGAGVSLVKGDVGGRAGNVCKVKPQQQPNCSSISPGLSGSPPANNNSHSSSSMYLGGTAAATFGGIGGAIPSPPTVMFNSNAAAQQLPQTAGLFQTFLEGTPMLNQRGASQFSQYAPYGIGQGLATGNNAFGQQSMLLQTPPPLTAPADLYSSNLSQYRLPPTAGVTGGFGQSQPQQNTVLISSASNTLMSSAVKPSTHNTFGNSQQNFGTSGSKTGTPFQQSGLGGALQGGTLQGNALQGGPQTPVYIIDPSHSMGLLNSQLVQRPGVQNSVIQAIQTPSSFYSNNGTGAPPQGAAPPSAGTLQQGYYTASGSPLQAAAAVQQTPHQPAFGLQSFGTQSAGNPAAGPVGVQNFGSAAGLNTMNQQFAAQAFRNNQAAGLQASFLKSLQPAGTSVQDVARQQIKSPNSSHNSFASSYFPNASGELELKIYFHLNV